MPKEIVTGSLPIIGTPEAPEVEGLVQVSWGAEQEYVQIATGTRTVAEHESNHDEWWFVDLDRRGINSLIRNLRRARDQAYGRDE